MLWRRCICCFRWKLNEVRSCEQHLVPHSLVSHDSEKWRSTPYRYQERIAVNDSLKDLQVNMQPVVGSGGTIGRVKWRHSVVWNVLHHAGVYIDVQRTMKHAEMWVFHVVSVRSVGLRAFTLIISMSCKRSCQDQRFVCVISTTLPIGGASFGRQIDVTVEAGWDMTVKWTKAHILRRHRRQRQQRNRSTLRWRMM